MNNERGSPMKTYRISDLLDLSAVQKMAEAHYRATGMPVGIVDALDDAILVSTAWQDICSKFHRVHPEALKKCQASEKYIKEHLVESGACRYKCQNGLWNIALPISVAERHLATLFLGQFFYEGEIAEREIFIRQAREFGFDLDDYLAALDRVRILTNQEVDNIIEYNKGLVAFITDIAERSLAKLEADEAVLKQQYFLQKAQEIGQIATFELDLKTCEMTWTDELYRIFGLPVDMPITYEKILNCVHPDDRKYVEICPDAPFAAEILNIEYRIVVDGSLKWIKRKAEFKLDEKDEITGVIGVVQDITERKLTEEALAESGKRLRLSLAGSGASFWEWRPENNYIYFDDYWWKMMGYAPGNRIFNFEVLKKSVHPDSKPLFKKTLQKYIEGSIPRYEMEYRIKTPAGEWKWIWVAGECMEWDKNKRPLRFIGIQRDITPKKQAEEEIRSLNETLEERVARRTAELEERRRQIQRLALELSEVENRERQHIATILHDDFQQELAYIKIEVSLMARDNADRKVGQKLSYLESLIGECIEKSRNLSYELNPPGLRRGGLPMALEILGQDMEDNYGLKVRVRTRDGLEPISLTHASVLHRSARELLFNVVKHAGTTSAFMDVGCRNGMIYIRVKDFGRGFDYDAVRSREGRGVGFGLYQLTERITFLGGTVNIRTGPGKGCCVVLKVPRDGNV
ncbi:hypothetical protein B2D07_16615 [Desulfococcus multivorans]|nr:hypothetical protein B2D07_16615 [Desulfococcus multivorans]